MHRRSNWRMPMIGADDVSGLATPYCMQSDPSHAPGGLGPCLLCDVYMQPVDTGIEAPRPRVHTCNALAYRARIRRRAALPEEIRITSTCSPSSKPLLMATNGSVRG